MESVCGNWENGRVLVFRTAIEQGTFVDDDLQFLGDAFIATLYRILMSHVYGDNA